MPDRVVSPSPLTTAAAVRRRLKAERAPEKVPDYQRYFRTGPGQYGEGDRFHGATMPKSRRIARAARGMARPEIVALLKSPMHEERMVALLIMVDAFRRAATAKERTAIYRLYVGHLDRVNNWDLVDGSAPTIVGGYLEHTDRGILYRWARSPRLWERRVAVLATFRFIDAGDFEDALALARMLRDDEHDLIHKAVGWMLREVGNRDREVLEGFLREHSRQMPRTMLRYAIEKLPETRRQAYLRRTA